MTISMPPSPAIREELHASEALASSELRRVLTGLGHPAPGATIRLASTRDGVRAIARIPQDIPWRVADTAVVRALRQVRAVHPRLRLSDRRFETTLRMD